jgi:hypothetical protein
MKEEVTITVTRYFTPEGKATCACNFDTGEVCRFLGARNFGFEDVCMLNGERIRKDGPTGFTIPHKDCIMHRESKGARS